MEYIIKSQVSNRAPGQIFELILDKWRGTKISEQEKGLLETFFNLETLSLIGCGLKTLENFPNLPNLLKLELCDNKLKGSLKSLKTLSSLTMLSLAGNQISSLEDLQDIVSLANIASLDLYGCPVTNIPDYSAKVFGMFINLQVLDGMDKNGEEVSVASEDEEEDSEEYEENDEENDLSDFIEQDDLPLKRRRESDDSANDPECKKIPTENDLMD